MLTITHKCDDMYPAVIQIRPKEASLSVLRERRGGGVAMRAPEPCEDPEKLSRMLIELAKE